MMKKLFNSVWPLGAFGRRLLSDRRGNIMMMLGFAMLPMVFAVGMGIDYSRAMRTQSKLNAAADAAALAAVTTPMMSQSSAAACALARKLFIAQAANLEGLQLDTSAASTQITFTIKDSTGTNNCSQASAAVAASYSRTITVSYNGQSTNDFGSILGIPSLTVHGTSQALQAVAPNIDFYVMLDTSPSMLLPATSAGLATMTAATSGCAFACHQTGSTNDNYSIARAHNIVLRTDLVTSAVQDLTTVAATTSATNRAIYRMGLFDFDYMYRNIWPTTPSNGYYLDTNLSNVSTHVTDAQIVTYCANNTRVCNVTDNDTSTNFTTAFSGVNAIMPTPGQGTNNATDKPQAILFIITDGMRDELTSGNGRALGPIPTSGCDTIKNRGIRIAVLDTQYLPASASDSWSISNVKTPYLSPTDKITPALTACASPGLFYQVTTDSDISAALTALFEQAVATAHLLQ
jgi:Flp pilus assembly protein TadG